MAKEKTKEKEPKHPFPRRQSGYRQRKKLTPEESERILKRVFLGIDDKKEE